MSTKNMLHTFEGCK